MLNRFEQFSSIISGINRCIRKIETEEMEKYGCKGAYAQYLITLAKNPEGLSLAKLSDICDKDKSAVSRYIFEMQEKNLVTKENKTSGKYNARITLTNDGYRAYEYIHTRAMEIVRDAVKDISDEKRENILAAVKAVQEMLDRTHNDRKADDALVEKLKDLVD